MGEPVEGVVLALTDIDTALAGEELLDFGGKLLILEPGARALVQKALSLPKWQQEELTRSWLRVLAWERRKVMWV
jgi:hypothetical protein